MSSFKSLIPLVLLLLSCVPDNVLEKKTLKLNHAGDPPDDLSETNYLQGRTKSFTTFILSVDAHGISLRGKEIDSYIRNGRKKDVHCLVSRYPESLDHRIFVMTAEPHSLVDKKNDTREYYYLLYPGVKDENTTHCSDGRLTRELLLRYPGETISYVNREVCPSCPSSFLEGEPLILFTALGDVVEKRHIRTGYLTIRLDFTLVDSSSIFSCQDTGECKAKEYDCCLNGVCVKNGSLKYGAEILPGLAGALDDVDENPARLSDYPQFFNICGINVPAEHLRRIPITRTDREARERFKALEEIYNCLTPKEGVSSVCTIKYPDATNSSGILFETRPDDRSFSSVYSGSSSFPDHSIVEIIHDGQILYGDGIHHSDVTISGDNDDLIGSTEVTLSSSRRFIHDDTLKIRYKVDGSCRPSRVDVAACSISYVQGQNEGKVDDHSSGDLKSFTLPFYVDTSKVIKVLVNEIDKFKNVHWELNETTPPHIAFKNQTELFLGDKVEISFFVDLTRHPVMDSLNVVLEELEEWCNCGTGPCSLRPVERDGEIVDYACKYSSESKEIPHYQEIQMSSKTIPVRFYDENGRYHKSIDYETPDQEGRSFEYVEGDLLKPNNALTNDLNDYVGFHEIYGSLSPRPGNPLPAKEVAVKKGLVYDIYVDTGGGISTCYYCGTDYFSRFARLFPDSFHVGGYLPDEEQSNPFEAEPYRVHDLIFGKACFVPATMIPWTHEKDENRQRQRMLRMKAQHFLFANGYQRDWYGFDYGALIGSFDGVSWFSIGNFRRVRALGNKLFLAINGWFGDLSEDIPFIVKVSEASFLVSDLPEQDYQTNGAECQQHHLCETDDDCASNLGWEYFCESVNNIKSKWPRFDENGNEIPGEERRDRLVGILKYGFGRTTVKRCVYRGKGAPCHLAYPVPRNNSYADVSSNGLNICSMNNYCQDLSGTGEFNDRIRRFARSVANQNVIFGDGDDGDLFGLSSPIIGRPYDYNGTKDMDSDVESNLVGNLVDGLCLPGRNPNETSFVLQNASSPGNSDFGDPVNSIGMTLTGDTASARYVSSCSIFDAEGDYFHKNNPQVVLNDRNTIVSLAGVQAISTNALEIFETLIEDPSFVQDFSRSVIEDVSLQENRCLRAAASTCHTDMDCAPSRYHSDKLQILDPEDVDGSGNLLYNGRGAVNKYDLYYWKEFLVCKEQDVEKEIEDSRKVCCREGGRELTIGTSPYFNPPVSFISEAFLPGIDVDMNNLQRNHRMGVVYKKIRESSLEFPPLRYARTRSLGTAATPLSDVASLNNQFGTLNEIGNKTCCTGNWIRQFHKNNGGGHSWHPLRMQNFRQDSFRCLNWIPCSGSTCGDDLGFGRGFHCEHTTDPEDADCLIRTPLFGESESLFEQLGRMELLGIPQIAVLANTDTVGTTGNLQASQLHCRVNPATQDATVRQDENGNSLSASATIITIPGLMRDPDEGWVEYMTLSSGSVPYHPHYYASTDLDNFMSSDHGGDIKLVFSEDKFSCCAPAGTRMNPGDDQNLCCTGFINPRNNLCQLPGYTNVSIYTNRYVSSEAGDVKDIHVNPETGYITNKGVLEDLACEKNICDSGVMAYGTLLARLPVPGHENSRYRVSRYLDGYEQDSEGRVLGQIWRAGARWNHHLYCIPRGVRIQDATIIECGR